MRQVFLDTETTGLDAAGGDRIIEIAAIEYDNRRETGRMLHHYINAAGRASHPDALRVHGITDEFLADKPLFASIAPELIAFVAGAEVIIHNAMFDVGFIDAELARLHLPPFAKHAGKITDSLVLAREQYPGKGNSLDALCRRLEVDNSKRELHGALIDADLLAQVFLAMTRGQGSLVVDSADSARGALAVAMIDLAAIELPVIRASDEERAAHAAVLTDIDGACKGKTVWRTLEPAAAMA
jgi:DNA polymerase III subunit epsilon